MVVYICTQLERGGGRQLMVVYIYVYSQREAEGDS